MSFIGEFELTKKLILQECCKNKLMGILCFEIYSSELFSLLDY